MKPAADIQHVVAERERGSRGTATVERLMQAGDGGHEADPTGRQRIVAAPLDRLHKQGFITSREFQAGDQYREDHFIADLDPSAPTVDWNRAGGSNGRRHPTMFTGQHIADARLRIRELKRRIPEHSTVSLVLYLGLIKENRLEEIGAKVFGSEDSREGLIAGRAALRTACAALADYYGA